MPPDQPMLMRPPSFVRPSSLSAVRPHSRSSLLHCHSSAAAFMNSVTVGGHRFEVVGRPGSHGRVHFSGRFKAAAAAQQPCAALLTAAPSAPVQAAASRRAAPRCPPDQWEHQSGLAQQAGQFKQLPSVGSYSLPQRLHLHSLSRSRKRKCAPPVPLGACAHRAGWAQWTQPCCQAGAPGGYPPPGPRAHWPPGLAGLHTVSG